MTVIGDELPVGDVSRRGRGLHGRLASLIGRAGAQASRSTRM